MSQERRRSPRKLFEVLYGFGFFEDAKRGLKFEASTDATKEELEKMALNLDSVKAQTEGKTIAKVIVVPGKIVNIVAK